MRVVGLALFVSMSWSLGCGAPAAPVAPVAPVAPNAVAPAAVRHESFEYKAGDATMEGYLAMPEGAETSPTKRPGVLVFHDWMGLGPNPKMRADKLAELG